MFVLEVEIKKRKIYSIFYKNWSNLSKVPDSCSTIKITSYSENFIKGIELFISSDSKPIEIPVICITSICVNHGAETKMKILKNRLVEYL